MRTALSVGSPASDWRDRDFARSPLGRSRDAIGLHGQADDFVRTASAVNGGLSCARRL